MPAEPSEQDAEDASAAERETPEALNVRRAVASGMVWSTIGRFGVLGFGLLGQALLARILAPSDFGRYALVVSTTGVAAMVAQLALPQAAVRTIAGSRVKGPAATRRAVLDVIRLLVVTAAVATAAGMVGGPVLDAAFPDARLGALAAVVGALVGVRIAENVLPEVFRGLRQFREASLYGGVISAIVLAAVCAGALVAADKVALRTALLLTVGASCLSLLVGGVVLARWVQRLPRASSGSHAPRPGLLSASLWAGTVFSFMVTQLDLWVVGRLARPVDVALYGVAFRLSTLVMLPASIANAVVPPLVPELIARGERRRLAAVLQTTAALAGGPSLVLLLAFIVFGGAIAGAVFGPFYADAGVVLALLAAGKIANVLTGACGTTLLMAGGQRQHLVIVVTNVALTLPLQIAGFHRWGLRGVAGATALGLATQNLMLMVAVHRLLGVWTTANPRRAATVLNELRQRGSLSEVARDALGRATPRREG